MIKRHKGTTRRRIPLHARLFAEIVVRPPRERDGVQGNGDIRLVWQCIERYRVKGVLGCSNRHIGDSTLHEIFIMAWNKLAAEKRFYTRSWKENIKGADLLNRYYAREFIHMVEDIQKYVILQKICKMGIRLLTHEQNKYMIII